MTPFSLIPFADNCPHPDIQITGQIERLNQQLSIIFQLTGEIQQVAIAPPDGRAVSFSDLILFCYVFNRLWGKQSKVFCNRSEGVNQRNK